jgi:hypothetical protein
MKYPLSYNKLDRIFLNARDPDIKDFQGEFSVDILSVLPSFRWLSHRKVIYVENGNHIGHNVLSGKKWGKFSVSECDLMNTQSVKTLMFNYNMNNNFFLLRGIRDYVRCVERDTLYIGKFSYVIFNIHVLIGYFSLEKIK